MGTACRGAAEATTEKGSRKELKIGHMKNERLGEKGGGFIRR